MMTSKKPCINNPSFSYTGNEQSPLHFGLSAEGYPINSVMEGYDKKLWAVEIKNNKKVWIRKDDSFKVTHEEPVIKPDEIDVVENEVVTPPPVVIVEKKTTDYNLYLSWRLKQLKEENTSDTQENKKNFAKVLEEWKLIKHKPDELKKVLEEAKAHMLQKTAQPKSCNASNSSNANNTPNNADATNVAGTKKKIGAATKLPSIQEEKVESNKSNKKNKK